jgi:hypothetical protein
MADSLAVQMSYPRANASQNVPEILRFQRALRQKCAQVLVVSFGHQAYCLSIAADVQETQDMRMRQQSGEHGKFAACTLRLREAPSLDGHVRLCAFFALQRKPVNI